jgi:hypothetical protein
MKIEQENNKFEINCNLCLDRWQSLQQTHTLIQANLKKKKAFHRIWHKEIKMQLSEGLKARSMKILIQEFPSAFSLCFHSILFYFILWPWNTYSVWKRNTKLLLFHFAFDIQIYKEKSPSVYLNWIYLQFMIEQFNIFEGIL